MNVNLPMQPMPVEYLLCQSVNSEVITAEINAKLKEGWTMHGPTFVELGKYHQPMVRLELRPITLGADAGSVLPVQSLLR